MILVVGGIKGGSGKTTLATNLVVMRSSETNRVLFVDADEQKSASSWLVQRKLKTMWSTIQLSGRSIYSYIDKVVENYDDIIIDVGGRDTTSQRASLGVCDIYLVPFKPRSLDIWTIEDIESIISKMKSENENLKSYSIINQADPNGRDNNEAIEILSECEQMESLDFSIGNRKSFANASSDGLGVVEMKKKDMKACEEMKKLYEKMYN